MRPRCFVFLGCLLENERTSTVHYGRRVTDPQREVVKSDSEKAVHHRGHRVRNEVEKTNGSNVSTKSLSSLGFSVTSVSSVVKSSRRRNRQGQASPFRRRGCADALNSFIEFDFARGAAYLAFSAILREALRKAAKHKLMYLKCAHPECSSDFDYGQGRLFRFQQTPRQEKQPAHWHAVKHYWLCSRCSECFTIEYERGMGVLLMERLETLAGKQPCYFVLQAEIEPRPALPRRVARSRTRQMKHKSELAPVAVNSIEVLETRNLERRGSSQ
jgi:hypothetical protein